jgi:copper chaperone CopZ
MQKHLFYFSFLFLMIALGSCSTENSSPSSVQKNETSESPITSKANISHQTPMENHLGIFSISGMVSEIKCAGTIRKVLTAMTGITEIEFDFKKERNINFVTVKFDIVFTNENEIKSAIEKINEGNYKVEKMKISESGICPVAAKKKLEEKEITFSGSSSSSAGSALPGFPDIFDIL